MTFEVLFFNFLLACRSPYFEAVFRTPFKETGFFLFKFSYLFVVPVSGEIDISQFPTESGFRCLLEFLYTGKIQTVLPTDAIYLLSAIGYYGLEDKNIQLDIDESNALFIFEAADNSQLRERALRVIVDKFEVVSQMNHVNEMKGDLLAEIVKAVGRSSRFASNEKEKW